MDEHVVPGLGLGHECERDDLPAAEPARRWPHRPPMLRRARRSSRGTSGPSPRARRSRARRPCAFASGRDLVEHGLDQRALGDRAARRVDEMLAEVLGREMRQRAEPDATPASHRLAPSDSATSTICVIRSRISACSCIPPPPASAPPRRSTRCLRRAGVSSSPAAEVVTLDPEDDDPRRQPAERARELDRLADPERVGRASRRSGAGAARRSRRTGAPCPAAAPGGDGVDDERRIGALPGVDQPRRLELADDDVDAPARAPHAPRRPRGPRRRRRGRRCRRR